jgi:hypothetical protein
MNLTYLADTYFPLLVPEKDATFASSVGPHTVYPCGMSLAQALQVYWRAKDFLVVANGAGAASGVSQALAVNGNLGPRNVGVGTGSFYEIDGFAPTSAGEFVTGFGLRQVATGSGTITAGGGAGTSAAQFNLQVDLFYPEIYAPDPVVRYGGLWWPAMSLSCDVTNTVALSGGGSRSLRFACDTYDPASTTEIGTVSFFGHDVPVFCGTLAAGETRSITAALTVADEFFLILGARRLARFVPAQLNSTFLYDTNSPWENKRCDGGRAFQPGAGLAAAALRRGPSTAGKLHAAGPDAGRFECRRPQPDQCVDDRGGQLRRQRRGVDRHHGVRRHRRAGFQ